MAVLPSSMVPPREEMVAYYRELRRDATDSERRWVLLIKELRAEHGFGIFEAEEMALRDPALRRWVERQINTQRRCRKQALAHIRVNGEKSLIERDGETFKLRVVSPRSE
jgi:hypothetical protein